MPDWKREASRKLKNSGFSSAEHEDVASELAGYLEDLCIDAHSRGLDERAASDSAFGELHNDARLGPKLYRARKEGTMNDRTKGFWLPSFISLVAATVFLVIFESVGLRPYLIGHFGSAMNYSPVEISLPWLCVLPFLGGASAYLSRRVGSGRALRLTAGLFPVLVFLAGIVIVVPLDFAINGVPATTAIFPSIAGGVLSMVIIPGVALLLGVVPFLRDSNASRRIA